ncbi:hypothetical protein CYMTET_9446, partial [Cymbomonas tetramitiformis]
QHMAESEMLHRLEHWQSCLEALNEQHRSAQEPEEVPRVLPLEMSSASSSQVERVMMEMMRRFGSSPEAPPEMIFSDKVMPGMMNPMARLVTTVDRLSSSRQSSWIKAIVTGRPTSPLETEEVGISVHKESSSPGGFTVKDPENSALPGRNVPARLQKELEAMMSEVMERVSMPKNNVETEIEEKKRKVLKGQVLKRREQEEQWKQDMVYMMRALDGHIGTMQQVLHDAKMRLDKAEQEQFVEKRKRALKKMNKMKINVADERL